MDGGCYIPRKDTLNEKLRELKELDPKLHDIWANSYNRDLRINDPENLKLLSELLEKRIKEKGLTLEITRLPDNSGTMILKRTVIALGDTHVFSYASPLPSENEEEDLLGSYLQLIKEYPKLIRE